jgi:hypothetical protein
LADYWRRVLEGERKVWPTRLECKPFIGKAVYRQSRLQAKPFTGKAVYRQSRLQAKPFTGKAVYRQSRLQAKLFTGKAVYRQSLLHFHELTLHELLSKHNYYINQGVPY